MELRDGQHIGVETNELLNRTPSEPKYFSVFVMVVMEPEKIFCRQLIFCRLLIFCCLLIFSNLTFSKNSFRNTIGVSNSLDPDQA